MSGADGLGLTAQGGELVAAGLLPTITALAVVPKHQPGSRPAPGTAVRGQVVLVLCVNEEAVQRPCSARQSENLT